MENYTRWPEGSQIEVFKIIILEFVSVIKWYLREIIFGLFLPFCSLLSFLSLLLLYSFLYSHSKEPSGCRNGAKKALFKCSPFTMLRWWTLQTCDSIMWTKTDSENLCVSSQLIAAAAAPCSQRHKSTYTVSCEEDRGGKSGVKKIYTPTTCLQHEPRKLTIYVDLETPFCTMHSPHVSSLMSLWHSFTSCSVP